MEFGTILINSIRLFIIYAHFIIVFFVVLEDDGGNVACAVNTACLALIDSGFSMKYVFAGLTCAVIKDDKDKSHIILDADSVTMRKASDIVAQVTFVFESRKKDILASHVTGKCTEEVFQECLRIAKNASDKIFQFYREVVQKKFSKECIWDVCKT